MNKSLARTTFSVFGIAFCMPVLASYIGMSVHHDTNSTDAGFAPILIGIYNIPFMIGALITLLIGKSLNAKAKYESARTAFIIGCVICAASLAMVVPWGLIQ